MAEREPERTEESLGAPSSPPPVSAVHSTFAGLAQGSPLLSPQKAARVRAPVQGASGTRWSPGRLRVPGMVQAVILPGASTLSLSLLSLSLTLDFCSRSRSLPPSFLSLSLLFLLSLTLPHSPTPLSLLLLLSLSPPIPRLKTKPQKW